MSNCIVGLRRLFNLQLSFKKYMAPQKVTIFDAENGHFYNVILNADDAVRFQTDHDFANSLLIHAREHYEQQDEPETHAEQGAESESVRETEEPGEEESSTKLRWSYSGTLLLIRSVQSNYEAIQNPKKKKYIWTNISEELLSQGVIADSKGYLSKWRNLIRTYKSAKDNQRRTGQGPSRFFFFEEMDEFLGAKASVTGGKYSKNISSLASTSAQNAIEEETMETAARMRSLVVVAPECSSSISALPSTSAQNLEEDTEENCSISQINSAIITPLADNEANTSLADGVLGSEQPSEDVRNTRRTGTIPRQKRNVTTQYLLARADYYRERVLEIQELREHRNKRAELAERKVRALEKIAENTSKNIS